MTADTLKELAGWVEAAWFLGLAGGIVIGWVIRPIVGRIEAKLLRAKAGAE